MFQMLRKCLSTTIAIVLILQHFAFLTFAAGDLTIINLNMRGNAVTSYAGNPGTTFSLGAGSINNLAESIQSVFLSIDFGNNAGFSYQGVDQRTRINSTNITNPIPASAYNSSTGFNAEITSPGTPQIGAGVSFDMIRSTGTNHAGFLIANDITTYENILTFRYSAQKVSDGSSVIGDSKTATVYANVKPHITDFYFEKGDSSMTTNQIQGDQAESINLIIKVKDYNGCANMDEGTVTADLTPLGMNSNERLLYASCDPDGKTAIFKKTGISTLAPMGDKIFPYTAFSARDENNNLHDPTDGNTTFDDEDRKTSSVLTVVPASAPSVSVVSISETLIGGPNKLSTTLSFSGSQGGQVKLTLGGDGSCAGGTILRDWTGSGSYTAHTATGMTVSASALSEGSNVIYFCVKNSGGNIGSINVAITKDSVAPSFVISPSISPVNVINNDSGTSIRCSENGTYHLEIGGNGTIGNGVFAGSGVLSANITTNATISNTLLAMGANTVNVFCLDGATNSVSFSGSINKVPPTPSMSGQTITFSDGDADNDGLDGRDLTFSWNNTTALGFSNFQSYRIYILPTSTAFSSGSQTYVALLTNANLNTWTGDSTLKTDSLGVNFISGNSYKACIAIMGSSGQLGAEGCTAGSILTSDTVTHPKILSAKFTSDTNLELTTDATLDPVISSHSGALVSFVRGTSTTAIGVASIASNKINFTIPSLGSLSATGNTLVVATGAIRANGGGYNDYFSSGSLVIADGQNPTVTSFSKTTPAGFGIFHTGSITFTYTFGEAMIGGGGTRIELTRTAGNQDSTTRLTNITAPSELASGTQTKSIDPSSLGLVSGTTYRAQVIGRDLANNSVSSPYVMNIAYDSVGPLAPIIVDAVSFGTSTPTLSWTAPLDDLGNGSGVGKYTLKIYNGANCAAENILQTYASIAAPTTSQILTPLGASPGTYSWNLFAIDNVGNTGSLSNCDSFIVDTNLPTITGQAIFDQTISNSSYAKTGDTLVVSANIANTDSAHIWLDMSSLAGSTSYNNVLCSTPPSGVSCSYANGVATYSFVAGFGGTVANGVRQVQFRAQNTSGLNETTALASITVDTTAPSVSSNAITSPNGGETWGGTGKTITWNTGLVTDTIGITSIRLEYSTGANVWNFIANTTNIGTYTWDITSLPSRNDYIVRLTAFDPVGNSASDISNGAFTIDRTPPTVPSNTLSAPNGGIYRGGSPVSILWNSSAINDALGLAANPISLEYSIDSGSQWTQIGTSLTNSGSSNWTLPSINTSTALVRITARDAASNTSSDVSDNHFIIDSTNPVQNISYAGAGGNVPQIGRKINNTGLDLTLSATDNYLDAVYFQFINTTDGLYWNNESQGWLGVETWSILCNDGANLGTNLACSNISTSISPTILDGKSYSLIFKSIDEAGNSSTSISHSYIGDVVPPNLTISTASGSFLKNGILLSGTASDSGSSVSSVKLEIKKGAQYWNGSAWTNTVTSLLTQTSNGYANWTYAFDPPLTDVDGQTYLITATADDGAYKTNNSRSVSIMVIKDTSGPTIDSSVFTFDTSLKYRGGNSLRISWNPTKITSTGAELATNPITLSYNFTGTVVTIASQLTNSGSYDITLPSIDTNTAKIIMTALDASGNSSEASASASFVIDSLPPTMQSATTMDMDLDGKIDAVEITMSEAIKDTSITLTNFSLGLGIGTPNSFTTGNSSNDTSFVLHFSNTGTTASAPVISYISGTLVDQADNLMGNVSNFTSSDGVMPRIVNAKIYDMSGNGKFDKIKVQFSENMQSATTNVFSINSGLPGLSIASVSRDSLDYSVFQLNLNESSNANTAISGMSLNFSNNGTYRDMAGNSAVNFVNQVLIDLAKPILLSASTIDATGNFKVDRIDVQFSESISGNIDGEFSLTGLAVGSSKGVSQIDDNILRISITETSGDNDTALTPSFSYSGVSLVDLSGNIANTITNLAVSDGVAPKLLSRMTQDFNGNGKVDTIKLVFSENLGTNLSAFTVSVAGFSAVGTDSLCEGSSTGGDATICTNLIENATINTDATPEVQINANSTLTDLAGNMIQTENSGISAIDGVGPVIVGARYDAGNAGVADDIIYLTFSENIFTGSLSNISSADFIVSGGGALSANSTTSYVDGNSAIITLGAGATALIAGTSKISILSGALSDALFNISPTEGVNNRVTVSSSVIINEVMWSGTGASANQYIELKNIGTTSVNINGWVISHAGGNGIDLTLPDFTLPGGGLYLIAKTSEAGSLLNVTPGLVTPTLSLTTNQNNLVLKSGSLVYDTAKANPWPSGDTNAPASMERRNPAGDGALGTNWYTAVSQVGFDAGAGTARGTPGYENIFDAQSPVISAYTPTNNALIPVSPKQITFNYSDSGGSLIDTSSASLLLQKWNGASFIDVTATYIQTGSIVVSQTEAIYQVHTLPFGKYRATFGIADSGGNAAQQVINFFVDQISFTISRNSLDIGKLEAESLIIGTEELVITVKTLGAGFTLTQNKISELTLTGGITQIQDFDGLKGFGFDYSESGSGNLLMYSGALSRVSASNLANYATEIDPNGNLKSYTYRIKFGAKIGTDQTAGVYNARNAYDINWSY